jgi:ABC-type multidrug transport system ATPase subunit/peptidoglycan/LPS O-acetylase OafA/YrhL
MSRTERLHSLDAVRAIALLLGIVLHGGFSFIPGLLPGIWATVDSQPSPAISTLVFTTHIFRMGLFFFIAGLFAHMMVERKGIAGFWLDRTKRIAGPMIVGWVVLFPAIRAVWIWGTLKLFHGQVPPMPANLPPPPLGAFPMTHLWFLYYLLLCYIVVIGVRSAFVALDRGARLPRAMDTLVRVLVRSGAAAPVLALPIGAALYLQRAWIMWFGIPTPDHSLIPDITALVIFGIAFTFGWLMQRQQNLLQTWARSWPLHLAVALAATTFCLSAAGTSPKLVPAPHTRQTLEFTLGYAVALWCWIFAITGIAVQFLSKESYARRYLADSSYWLYLAHLPVVAFFQVLVSPLHLNSGIKFALVLAPSLAILLLSYELFVRYTLIGEILNGVRRRRNVSDPGTTVRTQQSESATPLAELVDVRKRYGKVPALAGVDLQVRPGELVALLGPNGAGKSTAISLWLGLIAPDSGDVRLMSGSPYAVANRREVGVMMQEVTLEPTLRLCELVEIAAGYYPSAMSVHEALELTGTTALANRPYGKLSGGQKRQAQFAMAICGRPRLLFLDEPTVGLDIQARELMWTAIRRLVSAGTSIVLTTHYLEEAEALADRVIVLGAGRVIASGSLEEVRSRVTRTRVTCSSAVPLEEIRTWPQVLEASRNDRRLEVIAVDAEETVRRLLLADPALRHLEVHRAGLAEAFSQITQEAA